MKRFGLNTGLIFASWALLLIFGCHKKKPPIPPEETAPTIISEIPTQKEPSAGQEPENPPPQQQQANNTPQPEKPAHKPPKHPKNHTPAQSGKNPPADADKPAPTEEATNIAPPRVVIQEGGTNPGTGQVATNPTNDGGTVGQATTQQLLDSTENNLRNIKHQLSDNEKSMVAQIQDWIKQSKDATKDGDNPRAHNLALRARLLSDELVKGQ